MDDIKTISKSDKKESKSKLKRLLPLIITISLLLIVMIAFLVMRSNQNIAEFMTANISKYIVYAAGFLSSLIPFSIFEILVLTCILAVITLITLGIIALCKKKYFGFLKGLCIALIVILSAVNIYSLTAGFSYNRKPLELPLSQTEFEKTLKGGDTVFIGETFLNDYAALSAKMPRDGNMNVISPYSFSELSDALREEFKRLDNPYFYSYTPKCKTILNSWFMSSTLISGISFLPTGEPNVNAMTPSSELPQVMAHEMAHTKGVMRENDANMVSYYLLLTSENEYLRYCGYFSCFTSLYDAIYISNNMDMDIYTQFVDKVPTAIITEKINANRFWWEYKGPFHFLKSFLNNASAFFNDLYLKMSGSKNGTGDYGEPNDSDISDSGNVDENGDIIYNITYSKIQKMFFSIFESSPAWLNVLG